MMHPMPLWKRYFIIELGKMFVLFLASFYFLYILIDYSAHSKAFQHVHVAFKDLALYYICQFTKRADTLLPIALMVSAIKVLTTSNLRNEILALTTGGISLKKIASPFIQSALFCAFLLYLNFQFLQPLSLNTINSFEMHHFKEQSQAQAKRVNTLVLEDNSLLIYQKFDPELKAFCDVFWVKSCDNLCRIHTLFPFEKTPSAEYIDFFERNSEGELVKTASVNQASLEMHFDKHSLKNAAHPPRMQSITQLALSLKNLGLFKMSDREAESAAIFYFKLTIPLACLLAILVPLTYCVRISRNLQIFFIYALSLFGIIAFFMVTNSFLILGESQVLPPAVALVLPQLILFLVFGWKYARL